MIDMEQLADFGKLLDNRKHLERDMERRFEICRLDG